MVKYVPDRGDVVWLDFDPQKGKEIQKTRPAGVIYPREYNQKTNLGIFMPIPSQIKGYPFEVILDEGQIKGAVLSDQIRSLDWHAHHAKFIMKLSEEKFLELQAKMLLLLA